MSSFSCVEVKVGEKALDFRHIDHKNQLACDSSESLSSQGSNHSSNCNMKGTPSPSTTDEVSDSHLSADSPSSGAEMKSEDSSSDGNEAAALLRDSSSDTNEAAALCVSMKKARHYQQVGVSRQIPAVNHAMLDIAPLDHVQAIFKERGWPFKSFQTLDTIWLKQKSEGVSWVRNEKSYSYIIDCVTRGDLGQLTALLNAGLSVDSHNCSGHSLLHKACRNGNISMVKLLLSRSAKVKVCDDCGKTPLHDACWAASPSPVVLDMLLTKEPSLICSKDKHNATPMEYVHRNNWREVNMFLCHVKDKYWPFRDSIWCHNLPFKSFSDMSHKRPGE